MGGPYSSPPHLRTPPLTQAPRSAPVLVGREREMTLLRAALDDALTGRGRLVLISGEPGIGKSTLAEALSAEAGARGARVSWARAPEMAGAPPYWLWAQTLRNQSATADPATLGRTPVSGAPELAAFLGDLPSATAAESEAARFRLCDEIASFLLRCAPERGHVVVLDDLHAADPASLEALAHLASRLSAGALLVVGTHRASDEDVTPALRRTLAAVARDKDTMHIDLSGLNAAAVRAQLTQVTGRTVGADLAERVQARTGGNPFFVGEVGRLLEHDAENGAAGLAEAVPLRVRDVIIWRLSRLPADTRDLLDVAALIGTSVAIDVLAAACAQPADAVLAALQPAFRTGVLQRVRSAARVQFAHGLVAETIAETMPVGRAAQLHQQVASAIETTRATTIDDWLPALARHWAAAVPSEGTARRLLGGAPPGSRRRRAALAHRARRRRAGAGLRQRAR